MMKLKSLGEFKSRNVIVVYNALSTTNSEINFTKLNLIIIFKIKEPRLHRLYGEIALQMVQVLNFIYVLSDR